jgi:hypothetical protein
MENRNFRFLIYLMIEKQATKKYSEILAFIYLFNLSLQASIYLHNYIANEKHKTSCNHFAVFSLVDAGATG